MEGPAPIAPPHPGPAADPRRTSFAAGWRAALPFALAGGVVSISFGVLAREAGMPIAAAIAMSAIVYAGSAQFASIAILASGGTLAAAVGAAVLMNSRFLPMGIALAPSLPGGPLKRAAQGQPVVDASWALAAQGDGSFDRWHLFGASAIQYVTWVSGTVVGALAGDVLGKAETLGLDAIFPAFFLALLMAELKNRRARGVAAVGAVVALALVPLTPPGIPVLVASLAALAGLSRRGTEA